MANLCLVDYEQERYSITPKDEYNQYVVYRMKVEETKPMHNKISILDTRIVNSKNKSQQKEIKKIRQAIQAGKFNKFKRS